MKLGTLQAITIAATAFSMTACKSTPTQDAPSPTPSAATVQASLRPSKPGFLGARLDPQIALLSNQFGVSITALDDIGGERVSNFDNETDLESALDTIARPKGWTWFRNDDGSYGIASEEWYRANTLGPCMSPTKVFRPDHVRASELEPPLRTMLSASGRMNYDDRTNKIIIVDSHDSIARIERFMREVDQPPPH